MCIEFVIQVPNRRMRMYFSCWDATKGMQFCRLQLEASCLQRIITYGFVWELSSTESQIANRTIPGIAGLVSPEFLQRETQK